MPDYAGLSKTKPPTMPPGESVNGQISSFIFAANPASIALVIEPVEKIVDIYFSVLGLVSTWHTRKLDMANVRPVFLHSIGKISFH